MRIGERIKYLREAKGLTQKDVATKLGLESAAVSKYELNLREPNIEVLKKLSEIFEVSTDFLLGLTPNVYICEKDKSTFNLTNIKNPSTEIIDTDEAVGLAVNELCCGVGKTTYGLEFVLSHKDYLEDLITRSTYHSNAIEGSTLTYAETYAILYNDNSFKIEGKEPREIYEAINHKKALELVFKNLQNDEGFDEGFIKKLNETINRDIKDTEGYRTVQVFIQGSEHIPPEPKKVPNLMMSYIYNYNHDEQDIFAKIAKYHIEFEKIHPFEDGNGRTGRLLLDYELLKNNIPPVVISKKDMVKYFEFLRNNDDSSLAEWLKDLSAEEKERMEKFGYQN